MQKIPPNERTELATIPNETAGIGRAIRRTMRLGAISAWTTLSVASAQFRPGATRLHYDHAFRRWARIARHILGLDFDVLGDVPSSDRGRLIVSNHRTPLDIVPLIALFGGHFLANHKTRTAPVVGRAAVMLDTIFVDRDDRRSGANAIRQMRRFLEEKRTVVVFPEGTTHAGDEVRPFQRGAFVAAKGLEVDIVPVGIAYPPGVEFIDGSLGQHARRFLSRPVTKYTVAIGTPLSAEVAAKDEELVRGHVQSLVDKARAHGKTDR